jgi:hypothetical protein
MWEGAGVGFLPKMADGCATMMNHSKKKEPQNNSDSDDTRNNDLKSSRERPKKKRNRVEKPSKLVWDSGEEKRGGQTVTALSLSLYLSSVQH